MFISCSCDTHAAVTAGTHDPFMEVAPRPKKLVGQVDTWSVVWGAKTGGMGGKKKVGQQLGKSECGIAQLS